MADPKPGPRPLGRPSSESNGEKGQLPRPQAGRRLRRRLKEVPVLPSLITLGNLFFGFLAASKLVDAVVVGYQGGAEFAFTPAVVELIGTAAIFVFVAMLFDVLDGGVARLTNQATEFGAQLDSLADMVTFGMVPAFMVKVLTDLHTMGPDPVLPAHPKLYYSAAAVYVLCAAMRLARFNVETEPEEKGKREFRGLPSPGAAAVLCSMVAFWALLRTGPGYGEVSVYLLPDGTDKAFAIAMPVAMVVLGLLMISRVPYPHFAAALSRGGQSFPFLGLMVLLIALFALEWQFAALCLTVGFAFSGVARGTWQLMTRGRLDDDDDPDEDESQSGAPAGS